VTFTIVYDNNAYAPAGLEVLRTSWGFACWVETPEATVLFDTGGDGSTLLHNVGELGLDLREIDAVVLSHAHGDHTGGLRALLGAGSEPTVYVPASFSRSFKNHVSRHTDLVAVRDWTRVASGIHTTGEVGTGIIEQALVVETEEGVVVVTGCAHPGVERIVRWVHEHVHQEIVLVVGGFHLGGTSRTRLENIIADFREVSVQGVAPCHCTGDEARKVFDDAFGEDCALAGVGWTTAFELSENQ
jgi:7,8-dihydropterin-6-yl-methyl-4-(beta-D-ribofuranosyl)aminobenzene 5'-phosphate synthase